jgi:putative transport protein
VVEILVENPLLAVMLVIAAGAAVGQIPFGPLRFGAAGALFVGLAVGVLDPRIGQSLGMLQGLGLALFVFTVGLAAGSTFLRDLRTQWPLMGLGIVVLILVALVGTVVGKLSGVSAAGVAGAYAGALTSTPALAAASRAADGDPLVAVGYALAYPVGVVLAIIVVALGIGREWPGKRDTASLAGAGIGSLSVVVEHPMALDELPGWTDQQIKLSYHRRAALTRVVQPGEQLAKGDTVLVVGPEGAVQKAAEALGRPARTALTHDRADVDFRRFLISSPQLVGKTVPELNFAEQFGGTITRIKRGDLDMVAADSLVLQPGDRVLAVMPRERMDEAAAFFGDSERKISEIDALSFALGLAAGLLLGLVSVPLPGGGSFSLGTAAGPLVAGMVLGAVHRTGPLQWDLPQAANLTIRQLGLLIFLAAVGLANGPAFAESMLTLTGLKLGLLAAVVVLATAGAFLLGGRLLGLSAQRVMGAFAGLIGQPAILAFATTRTNDERVESGYAALFAVGIIAKITIVIFMVG